MTSNWHRLPPHATKTSALLKLTDSHPDWVCPDVVWVNSYFGLSLGVINGGYGEGGLGIRGRRAWQGDLRIVLGRLGYIIVAGRRVLVIPIFGRRRGRSVTSVCFRR